MLAKEWYTQPWEIDRIREEAPYEILRQLEMWRIEHTARASVERADAAIRAMKAKPGRR